MRMMLPDDLANRAQLLRGAEVGTEPPHDRAVAADDGEKTGFAAADDDVVRRETHVALIEPPVRPDVGGRVHMQPVVAASALVEAARGLDGLSSVCREA